MLNMFPGVSGTNLYTVSNVTNEISQIASDCGTDGTGDTLTTNICPGLVTYAGSMGYAFQATLSGNILPPGVKTHGSQISLAAAWNNLVNSINANEPMLLLVAPDTSGTPSHVTPVFAYSNTSGTDYYEYIADDGIPTWAQFQALDNSPYSVLNEIQINSVPEPSTWAMLIGGATSLLLFRRRRRS